MNSRERMLAAINHQPVDRIPTDIWATAEAFAKLKKHVGEGGDLLQALNIDGMADVGPEYIGPELPGGPVLYGIFGVEVTSVEHQGGAYSEQSTVPLGEALTLDDLARFRWPTTDWFDYSMMREKAEVLSRKQVVMCGYMAPFYFHNLLRGLEQSLIDPLLEPEFTHELIKRISDFFYDHHRRMFEAAGESIDIAQVTDDLGSQTGPLIGLDLYREFYAPHHSRFMDLCREFDIKVFHHDDGSIVSFLPDLAEMGVDILNPIQWNCPGMDRAVLKRDFGDRFCFHGAVENQKILPFGTPDEVRQEVRDNIDMLAADGTGYILASCHNIQGNTPVENIIAMYDEAHRYGKRS